MFKFRLPVLLMVCLLGSATLRAEDESAGRQEVVKAILATGADRQKVLDDLSSNQSKIVHDLLISWTKDGIFIYQNGDSAPVIPVLLEEQQNADGKVRAFRVDTGKVLTDDKGKELLFDPSDLNTVDTDMRLRGTIQQVIDKLALSDPELDVRLEAVQKVGKSQKLENIPLLKSILASEKNGRAKKAIRVAIATINLHDPKPDTRIEAIKQLAALDANGSLDDVKKLANAKGADADTVRVAAAAAKTVKSIEAFLSVKNFLGTIFRGMSSGSILLVVALGLAITFGLMGIINMAHGEMIAIGAYTCYVVENVFRAGCPLSISLPFTVFGHNSFGFTIPGIHAADGSLLYESYFLFVIPLSFIMSALAGLVLERTIIQFLYRRPLESLLATWGVSQIMQQLFRLVFGANNVQINSPSWLKGHFTVFYDVDLDYNRLFVIGFAVLIVIGTWLLLTRTPLGLLMRAVTQNRDMAACMGVPTQRVYMLTFAFGSGLAGLAGAFLSQIGNVGPSMGQTWIVDSFMTVVVGGVGNILGTVYTALGIGTADQVLQQLFDSPVVGKISVLIAIILFLQWKPAGLFPIRSRSLED